MSREAPRLRDYLGHILLEAIARIQLYARDLSFEAFSQSPLVQDAVIRNLEIIGEASRNIERHAPEFTAAHPELPLASAYEMRNALAHGYFSVDLGVVWTTIQNDLPPLREQVRAHLISMTGETGSGPS
jgi:uncharacterized protein with HEPN domain